MFQKQSFSVPSDSSGVWTVKVIQTRRCSTRKHADICKFLRIVIKTSKVLFYRRRRILKRRQRKRALVIRSQRYYFKNCGLTYNFANNSLVLLKRRLNTWGKEVCGPTSKQMKIKKFRIFFNFVF
jgi:ribosomal protein L14